MTLKEKFENYYDPEWIDKEANAHYCEQISDDYAIEFAEFCSKYHDKNRNIYGEMLHSTSKYDDTYTTKQLLEIFKKEKGL